MIKESTKSEFLLQFGKKLGEIKKQKKLSFRKIAQNCDLDASFISKIEKGSENITLETLLNLSHGLKSQPKDFFDFKVDLEKE